MGSDIGQLNMYYTDDDPPMDVIGKKRHFFGKPGIKAINQVGAKFSNPMGGAVDNAQGGRPGILRNPDCINSLKIVSQSQRDLKNQIET